MGQIVIDIPNQKKRRYVLADAGQAEELLKTLDQSAVRISGDMPKLSSSQVEDLLDYVDGKAALDEMRATGQSHTVAELREEFGI